MCGGWLDSVVRWPRPMGGERDDVTRFGTETPARQYRVDADGVGIAVYEWGSLEDPVLLLAHGGFDFARTFDAFAPRLAAGGWRVVAWDQRGHGDSDHVALGSWESEVRDAWRVLRTVTNSPVPFVGHSKGGGVMMTLAEARPDWCTALVNLDGMPSARVDDRDDEQRRTDLSGAVTTYLDRRATLATAQRKPGTLEDLAARRARMNPRLPAEWLEYLVTVGARQDDDGWRWKLDPGMAFGGFGPWRPEWAMSRMRGLTVPFLGVLGLEPEDMSWGTTPEDLEGWLPQGAELVTMPGVGHFVHIERPDEVAGMVLDFLARTGDGGESR